MTASPGAYIGDRAALSRYIARRTPSVVTYADVRAWLDKHGGVFHDGRPDEYPELGHQCPDCGGRSYFRHDAADLRSPDGLTYWAHPYDLYECSACNAVVTRLDLSPDLTAYPDFPRNWWKL